VRLQEFGWLLSSHYYSKRPARKSLPRLLAPVMKTVLNPDLSAQPVTLCSRSELL